MWADVLTQYTFEKVTSASDLVVGDKYAIVCESVTTPVAAGALATDGKSYGTVDVTITDNKIVTTKTGITTFTLGGEVDAYTLSPETGKYLGLKAYENSQLVTNVLNDSVRMHIDVDDSGTKIWNAKHSGTEKKDNVTTTYYCYYNYNSGQSYFRFYKKGSQKAIVLYKLTKTEQISVGTAITCSFDEAEYSTTIGETFVAPTLNIDPNTYDGTVVYESSNESVATVGTDGAITIVGAGQTTITATAPATDNYQAGEASYTLTIKGAIQDGILNFGIYQDYGSGLSFYGASVKEATWTAGNITMTTAGRSAWQESDGTFRLYAASGDNAAGSITLAAPTGKNLSKIVFTGSNLDNMSPDTGTLTNGTWTGSANSVTFTRSTDSSNPQIKTITVGYASDTAPEAPTFSPEAGTYYGIQQVTVSSATEGAIIKVKQSEDGEFETKTSEVTITESKTIWAYAEKDGEKSSTVSATYVIGTTETSIAPIITAAEAAGKDGKPVKYTYTPTPINVEYVNGYIAYLHDGTNGIMARSSSNFTWTTGSTIKGYLTGNAELYNGTPSIYVSAIEDETTGSYEPAPTTIEVGQIADNVNKYIKIEGATFVGADSQNNKNLTFKVNDTEFIAYNKFTLDTSNLVADKAYDLVGFGVKFVSGSNAPVYEIYPTAISEKEEETTYPITVNWDWQNENPASISSVNIQGTTGTVESDVEGYVLTVDATVENGKLAAGSNSTGKYAQYNQGTIIRVPVGSTNDKLTVLAYPGQYKYTIGGTAASSDETIYNVTASDVTNGYVEIVATGTAYIYSIKAVLAEPEQGGDEPAATDVTATWDWKNLIPSSISSTNIQQANEGDVESDVEGIVLHVISNGGKLAYNSSGYAQFNLNTTIQVPVKNKGDEIVVESFHGQSNYTIGGEDATNQDTYTYTASQSDATKGYVEMIPTKTAYLYSIKVTHFAPAAPTTLDNEPATATFPFNLGTAGQTATFSEGDADYFLNSKVELGANMGYAATRTLGDYTFTKIQPQTANASAAAEDYVLFRIQPKPGFTFTPSAASLVAYKDGTGNGTLTIAFVTADGTETTLATDQAIARNSETPAYTSLAYNDLSAVTPVEGAVGLKVYIGGNLATNKQVGLSNIIIEGTLSGTEKDLPILASFKANGTEYTVDEVFGDLYEADLELSKSESMISESNPLTEITATSGEVGTITYTDATETGCKVTIPVTAGETTLEYILNITQKPDFTLTYIGVDGTTVLNTQTVEKDATIGTFAQDIADVTASKDGYKARGWFKNNYVGEKWATTDVVTADAKLYAVETEIEVSSDSKKYVFDLTDKFFDADDHEAFNPTGSGKWHDPQHGWAFANGDKINLLVGGKASIIISLCKYAGATTKITASNGAEIAAQVETDGATASIEYDGEPGILTLSFDGTAYIHKLTIFNTTTTNYEKNGDWIIAKAGDASSFLDALDAANGTSGEDPVYIFLPNGTYDLAQTTKTNIGRSNVSIIGESMEGVIIKNRPVKEGIDITATLFNTSENLYMQDLTLDCVAPYGTGDDTSSAERGVTLHDKGTKTICKNVYLKGLQDTYYCNNNDGQYYFEDGKIEGTVDYICGHGDAYFNKVALFNAKRTNGNSGDVIAAPNTPKQYGYIFNECTIDGVDGQDGQYALGRPWASNTQVIFLNTTMKIQPKAEGWTEWSNDVAKQNSVKQFAEYGSVDASGDPVDTSKRKTTFNGVTNAPTLNETQVAAFALETVFAGWDPAQYTKQVKTTSAKLNGNTLTWSPVDGATMYAIVKNGSIIDLTNQTSYTIAEEAQGAKGLGTATEDPTAAGDTYAVRAANGRGGFGEAVVADDATGIDNITTDATGINGTITEVYSMGGARLAAPQKGVNIVKVKANDGSVKTMKVIVK